MYSPEGAFESAATVVATLGVTVGLQVNKKVTARERHPSREVTAGFVVTLTALDDCASINLIAFVSFFNLPAHLRSCSWVSLVPSYRGTSRIDSSSTSLNTDLS